ncbi:MAG: sensor histidine kinase [Clostridium sp.]|uniref:sensor histidine kinase n=1 Tax=Clostridium sp. TaxID=1506 RepID=UPI003F33312F
MEWSKIALIIALILMSAICLKLLINDINRSKEIKYIGNKIRSIYNDSTSEKVLLRTSDKDMKELLINLNKVMEKNQKNESIYINNEEKMRKMLSNISHDIKTPLTVILGYAEMMREGNNLSEEDKKELLNLIKNKGEEVVNIINKFFNLSKLESGDNNIEIAKVNVSEICRKSILEYYDMLNSNEIEVIIDVPEKDIFFYTDEINLSRILSNLISNSFKYGYEGKVIGLELREDIDNITIEVWDKGKGIDEVEKEKIFDRLYTLEDSRSKEFTGSGLGLTITKKLCEGIGGRIEVNSIPYSKTSFKVIIEKDNLRNK